MALADGISRRTLLVGGGIGAGLVLGWNLWPRSYAPNLRAAPGEEIFNAFLKIGRDGRVIVAVPQSEAGQGVYTSLPQILADELGADWRTVSVEPAPLNPLYANQLLAEEIAAGELPSALQGVARWAAQEYATRGALMLTGGSTSIRAFEPRMREAGAAARALLMQEAAARWAVEWDAVDTAAGFVVDGARRISFGELAEAAVRRKLPDVLPMRGGGANRLVGQPLPRLDLPSKVDGSAQFAADVRLPKMVYASVRQGPIGDSFLDSADKAAADRIPGVLAVIEQPRWVGAIANNWWAANRAVEAMKPVFRTQGARAESWSIDAALDAAVTEGEPGRIFARGDIEETLRSGSSFRAFYAAGVAPNAPLETLTATARFEGDRLEIWAPTQAPGLAREAAARAAGISPARVTVYRTMIGSGYGRKLETAAIEQAAVLAIHIKRPVQLIWSRIEETIQDSFRPPAQAVMVARMEDNGQISGWHARIAAPSATDQTIARLRGKEAGAAKADAAAVAGAVPPYAIAAVAIDHAPAATGLRLGEWRSGTHSLTNFFTESFIDELSRRAGIEPLSFRMQMLRDQPRLARVLTTAATLGGWDGGGDGSNMGLAVFAGYGSYAALLVEAGIGKDQRIAVTRAVCAVDCGRVINPEIVRQQIEGGIIYGIAGATGSAISFDGGLPDKRNLRGLGLPRLAGSPDVTVEIIDSDEAPGGVTELAVPLAAPAIGNAIFAATGQRLRSLPLAPGGAA